MQREKTHAVAGLSHAVGQEDTEMPDITREKFPDGAALPGMPVFRCINTPCGPWEL